MKQLSITLSFMIILASTTFCQGKFDDKYKKFLEPDSELIQAGYFYTIEYVNNSYIKKIYHPDKFIMTKKTTFSDEELTVKNGVYAEWYDDGSLQNKGQYYYGKKNGLWEYYHFYPKHTLQSKGKYENGKSEGEWEYYAREGYYKYSLLFKNSKKYGKSYKLSESQDTIAIISYEDDEIVEEIILDSIRYVDEYDFVTTFPYHLKCDKSKLSLDEKRKCSDKILLKTINKNISYPRTARKYRLEGIVILQLIIDEEGKIRDVITIKGLSDEIEAASREAIKGITEFSIPRKNGIPKETLMTIPIRFKLK